MKWAEFVLILLDNAVKYFFISLPFFLIYYVFFRKSVSYKKIQLKFPKVKDYARELGFSALSVIIFSIPPLIMLYSEAIRPHTTFYKHMDEHGAVYFVVAFPIMLFMHDAYFYWAHRIMHQPWLFKMVHLVHHKSTNPSPWAAYAFHPFEAIVESMIFVIFLFTIPVHAYRRENDKAMQWLETAYQRSDGWLVFLKGDPLMKNLRGDTRYISFMKKMNLPLDK